MNNPSQINPTACAGASGAAGHDAAACVSACSECAGACVCNARDASGSSSTTQPATSTTGRSSTFPPNGYGISPIEKVKGVMFLAARTTYVKREPPPSTPGPVTRVKRGPPPPPPPPSLPPSPVSLPESSRPSRPSHSPPPPHPPSPHPTHPPPPSPPHPPLPPPPTRHLHLNPRTAPGLPHATCSYRLHGPLMVRGRG